MKRKSLLVILPILVAVIGSAVLFSLRPLGYTAVSEAMQTEAAPPDTPLTEITVGDTVYQVMLSESYYNDADEIIDEYRVTGGQAFDKDDSYDGFRRIRVDRQSSEIISFSGISPYPPLPSYTQRTDEENAAEIRSIYSAHDFSVYDTFEIWGEPISEARNYDWSSAQLARGFCVRVTKDGIIDHFSTYDSVPSESDRLQLTEEECIRIIRRALFFDGMLDFGRQYTVTLITQKHTLDRGEPAIFCAARVVDEDGFVFVQSYTVKRQ